MPGNLPRLVDATDMVEAQETAFTNDALGRYVCSTWNEAVQNGGVAFDVIVIVDGVRV